MKQNPRVLRSCIRNVCTPPLSTPPHPIPLSYLLTLESVPPEEGLARLAGDDVKVVGQGLVPADATDLVIQGAFLAKGYSRAGCHLERCGVVVRGVGAGVVWPRLQLGMHGIVHSRFGIFGFVAVFVR